VPGDRLVDETLDSAFSSRNDTQLLRVPELSQAEQLTGGQKLKTGIWFFGLGTAFTGILNVAWRAFDVFHQPINSLGNVPGQNILACVTGVWLIAAGVAVLWRRSARLGAAACAAAYLVFAALWLCRYYAGIHALGWRIDVIFGVSFGLAQQLMLVAPATMIYVFVTATNSPLQSRETIAARWMLGAPPIVFGLLHLIGIQVFAKIVPHWIPYGTFWAALTGVAFLLAGLAICSGKRDLLAARLLALMLLLFEVLVEIPPIFVRLHDQGTWGAAVYNLSAIGAYLIFAEFLASPADRERAGIAENRTTSHPDRVVA
jgi:uncharacterized membrane protein